MSITEQVCSFIAVVQRHLSVLALLYLSFPCLDAYYGVLASNSRVFYSILDTIYVIVEVI